MSHSMPYSDQWHAMDWSISHLHERPEAEVNAVLAESHPPIAHLQHVRVWMEGGRGDE